MAVTKNEKLKQEKLIVQRGSRHSKHVAFTSGIIPSHLVGIFQATNPPIAVGSFIRNGQIVGYIESMKLLSELKSDIKGVVAEVFISDRQPVEYAQPLFRVVPSED